VSLEKKSIVCGGPASYHDVEKELKIANHPPMFNIDRYWYHWLVERLLKSLIINFTNLQNDPLSPTGEQEIIIVLRPDLETKLA